LPLVEALATLFLLCKAAVSWFLRHGNHQLFSP
jgi:hypothetical protein